VRVQVQCLSRVLFLDGTCRVKFTCKPLYSNDTTVQYRTAGDISFVDRSLALAYSQSCRNALIISEEHEFSTVPAQLTITPVIDYKIVREHEKLVEIYYDTPNDDEYVNQLVAKIRDIVKEVGGAHKIDAKILLSREEEIEEESFLFMKGDKLKVKLNASGFNVGDTTIKDVLEGAEIFSLSEFYEKSVVFVKPNVMF
jgi:hypothetical protein